MVPRYPWYGTHGLRTIITTVKKLIAQWKKTAFIRSARSRLAPYGQDISYFAVWQLVAENLCYAWFPFFIKCEMARILICIRISRFAHYHKDRYYADEGPAAKFLRFSLTL
jgi:hypothetical protein